MQQLDAAINDYVKVKLMARLALTAAGCASALKAT